MLPSGISKTAQSFAHKIGKSGTRQSGERYWADPRSMSAIPRNRTFAPTIGMSALCQKRTHAAAKNKPISRKSCLVEAPDVSFRIQKIQGGYLWSPERNANGARNPFYTLDKKCALSFGEYRDALLSMYREMLHEDASGEASQARTRERNRKRQT